MRGLKHKRHVWDRGLYMHRRSWRPFLQLVEVDSRVWAPFGSGDPRDPPRKPPASAGIATPRYAYQHRSLLCVLLRIRNAEVALAVTLLNLSLATTTYTHRFARQNRVSDVHPTIEKHLPCICPVNATSTGLDPRECLCCPHGSQPSITQLHTSVLSSSAHSKHHHACTHERQA